MKYIIILFTSVLLFLTHYNKVKQIILSFQNQTERVDDLAKAPQISISVEELNKKFLPIAENHNLSEPVTVYFVVNESGNIQNARFSESYNPGVSEEILELIKSAGVKPGTISGKPTSNGIGLMLEPTKG